MKSVTETLLSPVENLKALNDAQLLSLTRTHIQEEREATTKVLHDLLEIDRRKLFLARGYESLFKFVINEFGFTESETQTRIQAMRLIRAVPIAEQKLENGSLSLSNAAKLQSFLYQEQKKNNKQYESNQKLELVNTICNKTNRECEKVLLNLSPKLGLMKDRVKQINEGLINYQFNADESFSRDFEKFKNLISNQLSFGNLNEVFSKMLQLALERLERNAPYFKTDPKIKKNLSSVSISKLKLRGEDKIKPMTSKVSRYIPTKIRHQLFKLSQYQCEYIDPISKRRCTCKYKLTIDHKIPLAMGGTNNIQNLRVLCSKHNSYLAIQMLQDKALKYYER